MNRRLLSVTVFLALMLTSLLAGRHNYHVTRNEIRIADYYPSPCFWH